MIRPIEQLLAELVRIPSVNPAFGGSGEAALATWVADELRRTGADVWLQPVAPGRSNVVAALRRSRAPAILLEAHLDTVAAGGEWRHDPFGGAISDGRLYGRGACDTKGSLATFLHVFSVLAHQPQRLAHPLILAATIDEEVGQSGAYALMQQGLSLLGAVTGEPTGCRVVHAHKGFVRFSLRATGRAAHSSRPQDGDNAILRLAPVLSRFRDYDRALAGRAPHPVLGRPTVNIGTIQGGSGVNVVPAHCLAEVDRRIVPGESAESVRREIEPLLAEGVKLQDLVERPPLHTPPEAPLVASLLRAVADAGGDGRPDTAPYVTNAVAYAAAGVPAVVFGPGDVAHAHTPDECIVVEQLHLAAAILQRWLETPWPRQDAP